MTTDRMPSATRSSRRAVLAGALGGIGAWAASAVNRVSRARGADFQNMVLGTDMTSSTTTKVSMATPAAVNPALWGVASGDGVGLRGDSTSQYGVVGNSGSGAGVFGMSDSSIGVRAQSTSYIGVYGQGYSTSAPAAVGQSFGGNTGVMGFSNGNVALTAPKAKTGVYGYANQDSSAKGVFGESSKGWAGYFVGRVYLTKYQEMAEVSTPSAPGANKARLFLRESGGKGQLCVRFPTGAVQVIKSEP